MVDSYDDRIIYGYFCDMANVIGRETSPFSLREVPPLKREGEEWREGIGGDAGALSTNTQYILHVFSIAIVIFPASNGYNIMRTTHSHGRVKSRIYMRALPF